MHFGRMPRLPFSSLSDVNNNSNSQESSQEQKEVKNDHVQNNREEEEPEAIQELMFLHEPITWKGRLHPGVVQPEEIKKQPFFHEQIFE